MADKTEITLDLSEIMSWAGKLKIRLVDAVEYLRAAYGTIGIKDIWRHFDRKEGPNGRWKPRSPSTQKMYEDIQTGKAEPHPGVPRAAYKPSNKILKLTGNLRQSIVPGNARRLNAGSVLVFAAVPYSGKHDRGEGLPKRSFMWFSNEAKQGMADTVAGLVMP